MSLHDVLERWRLDYELTSAEADILRRAVLGPEPSRESIALARGVAVSTVKKQIQVICTKTSASSLVHAALAVFQEHHASTASPP